MGIALRAAGTAELDRILPLYEAARAFMRKNGNPNQWPEGYPPEEEVAADLARGVVYVAEEGDELLAVFTFEVGHEPVYDTLCGTWQKEADTYGFMHRLAVLRPGGGIGALCLDFCYRNSPHDLRVDTHEDNLPMQRLLTRCGFLPCGTVDYGGGITRLAYQKL